jgi:serine/threonine protein kinase/tetratricopeptide (TPR) repeat protein
VADAPDPFIGAAVDGWTIVSPLGQGAMGSVYEARKGDQRAAIKVIRPDATDQENLARFRREAKLLQRIEHRSLVRCLGAGDIERSVYLVLELLEGGSLQDVLDARGRLSPPEAVGVVRALLEGIAALHQADVIHRDVKPSNVLLDREGRAKLADLGLARPTEGSSALTATGTILGTPYYMAPELIRGADPAPSNDLYACGALLYCALVGEPPYPGKNPLHVLQAHLKEPVPDLRARAPHVPEKLAAVVDALLQKDPADRPATAAAALALLAPFKAAPLKPAKLLGAPPSHAASGGGTTRAQASKNPSAAARAALSTASAQAAAPSAPVRGPAQPLAAVPRRRALGCLAAAVVLVVGLVGVDRLARVRAGKDGLRELTAAADEAGAGTAGRTVFDLVSGARPAIDEALPWLALAAGLLAAERLLATRLRVGLAERLLLTWRARRLLRAGEVHQAALVWEQLGRRGDAAALLLARGMPALAADMFEAAGLLTEAQDARSKGEAASALGGSGAGRSSSGRPLGGAGRGPAPLERSGEGASAARALLEAGRVDEAIEAFRAAGRRYDAADLLEAKGRFTEALTELEAAWRAGGDGRDYWHHTGKKSLLEEARPRLAARIARLHERKDPLQAASWYERAGRAEEALALYEKIGDHRAAARCLLVGVPAEGPLTDAQAERAAAAAEALRKVGDHGAVSLFVRVERLADAAKTCRDLGDLASASSLFEQAGLLKEAAAAAEASGDKARAAALFDEGEEYVKAVELYEAAGQWSDAAEAASRAGQSEREAALRVKAGDRIGAAEVWLRLGRGEEALAAVQGVDKESGQWTQARTLAGEAHHRAGRHREAAAAFADGLPSVVNFREEVPSQLHYAESLEALGETERALQVLTRLEGKEIAPMDLNQRKGRLEPGRKGPPKGQPAAQPGESATRAAASGGAPTPGGSPRAAASRIVTPNELIGTALERYELLRYIGEGSFAWVFEARHTTLGREAAVKVLKPGLAMGEAPRRFLREGRAVAGLKHPHLIEIYDGGDVEGLYYLALEFVKGPTLRKLIADEAPFPVARAARIGAGILSGLGAAHKKGIIHRDLKPANVLVGAGMQAKVLDFGLARVFDDAGQSATAGYLGTPRYASPEQARGQEVGEGGGPVRRGARPLRDAHREDALREQDLAGLPVAPRARAAEVDPGAPRRHAGRAGRRGHARAGEGPEGPARERERLRARRGRLHRAAEARAGVGRELGWLGHGSPSAEPVTETPPSEPRPDESPPPAPGSPPAPEAPPPETPAAAADATPAAAADATPAAAADATPAAPAAPYRTRLAVARAKLQIARRPAWRPGQPPLLSPPERAWRAVRAGLGWAWARRVRIVVLLLAPHAVLLAALARAPDTVERLFGASVFPRVAALHALLDATPLSPGWTIGALLLLLVARRALRAGRQARRAGAARRAVALAAASAATGLLVVIGALLAHAFPWSWGLNYLRPSVAERLGLDLGPPDPAAWKATADLVITAANGARLPWEAADPAAEERAVDRAVRHGLRGNGLNEGVTRRARVARYLPPNFMAIGGWSGVTLPWTTEAMVDPAIDARSLPCAIAHEKAHQAGFAREADASFVAFLCLSASHDPRLRYSALFESAWLFAPHASVPFAPDLAADYQQQQQTDRDNEVTAVATVTQTVYDGYLRANQVAAGIGDYDRVALLIHAWLQRDPTWLDAPPYRGSLPDER